MPERAQQEYQNLAGDRGKRMTNANLNGADLRDANLTNANLTGATLAGVAWYNTTCPDGTNTNTNGDGTCVGHF